MANVPVLLSHLSASVCVALDEEDGGRHLEPCGTVACFFFSVPVPVPVAVVAVVGVPGASIVAAVAAVRSVPAVAAVPIILPCCS